MNISASNLAFDSNLERDCFKALREHGIAGIEVAPTKVWPNWCGLSEASAVQYKRRLEGEGFTIPALQSIFYGKNFKSFFCEAQHPRIRDHLYLVADLAAALGAGVVVMGAPSMRKRENITVDDALCIFRELMGGVLPRFQESGSVLCLEACSSRWGSEFITTHSQLVSLIESIDNPSFGLHVDSGNLYETGEIIDLVLASKFDIQHYHLSEPDLGGFARSKVPHLQNIQKLKSVTYPNWISIEANRKDTSLLETVPWGILVD